MGLKKQKELDRKRKEEAYIQACEKFRRMYLYRQIRNKTEFLSQEHILRLKLFANRLHEISAIIALLHSLRHECSGLVPAGIENMARTVPIEKNKEEKHQNDHVNKKNKEVTSRDSESDHTTLMMNIFEAKKRQSKISKYTKEDRVSESWLEAILTDLGKSDEVAAKNDSIQDKDADPKDSCLESCCGSGSNACNLNHILDHQGFTLRPQSQMYTVYTLDTMQAQNFTSVGGIPWAWLREEKWRLHTFAKYPQNTAKSAILLAEAGFAYIGSGKDSDDSVVCFFCRGMKRAWREDDDIAERHRALSRDCPMVTGADSGNIPLIPPDNVSFSRSLAGSQNDIDTDGCPTPSQEAARAGRPRQSQQVAAPHGRSNTAKAPFQLATHTVMTPPPSQPGVDQPTTVRNNNSLGQASDESGQSTVLTSSNTVPSYPKTEPASGQATNPTPSRAAQQSSQSPATAGSGHANPQQPGVGSEPSRNVADGGQANQTPASTQPANQSSQRATPSSAPTAGTNSSQSSSTTTTPSSTATTTPSSTTTTTPSSTTTTTPSSTATTTQSSGSQNPTYLELGIITERPKRYEYAVRFKRLETFGDWPSDHHLRREDLADAGFYYAGYGDCARCFYCGGGLRNWEQDDDVWVEHARWFPKCAFIRQRMGQVFIDTVAALAQTNDKISFTMVVSKMNIDPSAFQIDSKETPLKNDAAVLAVKEMGYNEADILPVASTLKESGHILAADAIFDALEEKKIPRRAVNISVETTKSSRSVHRDKARDEEVLNTLKQTNNDLRLQTLCKICMDKEVAVVFLPCGHLVCCTECASAMKDCPVCRNQVKGIVRAFMG